MPYTVIGVVSLKGISQEELKFERSVCVCGCVCVRVCVRVCVCVCCV